MSKILVPVDVDSIVPHLTESLGQTADLIRAIVARRGLGEVVERLVSVNSADAVLARVLRLADPSIIVGVLRGLDRDVREEICHHFDQIPLRTTAEPQVVGKAGEFITGGLRWRFVGVKHRSEAEACAGEFKGVWSLPTITQWVRHAEAVEKTLLDAGVDSFDDSSELSHVAWLDDGPANALWDIEERCLFDGSSLKPAGTFLVKNVEEV